MRVSNGVATYNPLVTFSMGTDPSYGLAVSDINLDGKPDILTANQGSNTISYRLGDGLGSFGTEQTIAVGASPRGIATGDINNDGRLDIVVTNSADNTVSALLNTTSIALGSFGTATNVSTGSSPQRAFITDVNLDGKPDLVVANASSSDVAIRLGDGLGGFSGTTNISVGTNPVSVFVADMNLDGKPDFVTANQSGNSISVRLGDGAGGFSGSTTVSVGTTTRSVFVADVNLDGKPDLITANRGANSVSIRLGDGMGNFSGTTEISVGNQPLHVFVADVNLDGRPDIVTANTASSDASVVLNDVSAIPDYTGPTSDITPGIFNNVTFTASGALTGDVTINAILTLNAGVISDLNGNTITVANNMPSAVAGAGFISGTGSLVRAFSGDFAYTFPFLEGSNNRTATVHFTSGTSTGNLTYQFFNTPPGNAGLPQTYVGQTIGVVAPFYWRIDASGTPGTYTLSLSGENTVGVTNVATLRIAKRAPSSSWSSLDAGTGSANIGTVVNPTVSQSGLVGFGEVTIGGAGGADNPLPVSLTAFTGRAVSTGIELNWLTISEIDNAGFAVLRNGEPIASYQTISSLQGQGTTVNETRYTFIDNGVQIGSTYTYRLRSFDLNGTLHDYPNEVTVRAESVAPKVYRYELSQNYPNPFNPMTRINYELKEAGFVSLKVYDVMGREVATLVNGRQMAGEQEATFNATGLASGVYFYRLQAGNFTQTKKMMLVK